MPEQTARRRSRFAVLVCSLLLAALIAHGVHEAIELSHDHSVEGALVTCFVFATVFAPLALSLAPPQERPPVTPAGLAPQPADILAPHACRPRASPAWLQQFRN
jgi:hypothetical protein